MVGFRFLNFDLQFSILIFDFLIIAALPHYVKYYLLREKIWLSANKIAFCEIFGALRFC
jgi:hypothetical protein